MYTKRHQRFKQRKNRSLVITACLLMFESTRVYAQTVPTLDILKDNLNSDASSDIRSEAIRMLRSQVNGDPIAMATVLDKNRLLDDLMEAKEYTASSEIALACINGQPRRLERVDYFISIRFRALLMLNRNSEALSLARSYYNVCSVDASEKAIDYVVKALKANYPDQPEMYKRFLLQQLSGAKMSASGINDKTENLGEDILATVQVPEEIYISKFNQTEKNKDWRALGEVNLLLLRNKPEEAMQVAQRLQTSKDLEAREIYPETIARIKKAMSGCVAEANQAILEMRKN